MKYKSFEITLDPGETKKVRIRPEKGLRIAAVEAEIMFGYKIRTRSGYSSEIPARNITAGRVNIPIDSKVSDSIEIEISSTQGTTQTQYFMIISVSKDEDYVKNAKQILWMITKPDSTPSAGDPANWAIVFWNPYQVPVYLVKIGIPDYTIALQDLYIGRKHVGPIYTPFSGTAVPGTMYPIHRWILPRETVRSNWSKYGGNNPSTYKMLFYLSDKEYVPDVMPFRTIRKPRQIWQPPGFTNPVEIPKGVTPLPPPHIHPHIPPYPIPPGGEIIVLPTAPRPVPLDVTARYGSQGSTTPTRINTKEETLTVEGLVTPFGSVRKSGDTLGRIRTTGSGINYDADTLETTDTGAHSVWKGYGSKSIFLHAVTGSFTAKILTLWNWLAGNDISFEADIEVDEAEAVNIDIEAREIQITATAATAATIEWEVTR